MPVTKLPPDSPIDLRALVLYDISQQKTVENSYENFRNLCELLGRKAISVDEYEYWFKMYSEENERELPIPDIRGCILSNVINEKSAEESIDNLCEAFKNCKIDKEDHDYWYKRFNNGHLFTRVTFSDLPEDYISEIVKNCDFKTHLNLRNVSYGLREIANRNQPVFTAITVEFTMNFERFQNDDQNPLQWSYSGVLAKKYQKLTLRELEFVLGNPKLRLKSFNFETVLEAPRVRWFDNVGCGTLQKTIFRSSQLIETRNSCGKVYDSCWKRGRFDQHFTMFQTGNTQKT